MQKVVQLLQQAVFIRKTTLHYTGKAFFMTVFTLFLLIGQSYAQDNLTQKKIDLELRGISLKDAFFNVQKQSGINFVFSSEFDPYAARKVSVIQRGITVKAAIELLLKNTTLRYRQVDDQVIIDARPAPPSPNAAAGQGTGGLKGRIVEFETSQPLPGASVYIVELKRGGQSDENGYYHLTGIPPGRYTLQVSFVSYTTGKVPVSISANREATYDVRLQGDNALEEVTVTAIGKTRAPVAHTTERQLVQEIRNMSIVVSGISSQQISMSADRNAAQSVQRISGVSVVDDKFVVVRGLNPRYNLTYLNGNVAPSTEVNSRAFALDLIPSRIIDRILVYKSPSPENQADATGGVVKIYTKDAKTVKHFDVEFQLGHRPGTSFNSDFLTYNGGKFDFLGFDDGTRALPKAVPAYGSLVRAQLSPSQYAEAFSSTLAYGTKTAMPNMQLTANYYDVFRLSGKNLSSLTSFSYKNDNFKNDLFRQEGVGSYGTTDRIGTDDRNINTAQSNLMQNFSYALNENHTFAFKNFLLAEGTDATVVRNSRENLPTDFPTLWQKDITLSYNQRFLYAGNFGGTHKFAQEKHKLVWNAGYTSSRQETPDQRVIRLTGADQEIMVGDSELQWRARGLNPVFSNDDIGIPRTLGIISRIWSRNSETVYNGSLDYAFNWKPWFTAKLGTFQQWKARNLDRRLYTVHEGNVIDPDIRVFTSMLNDNFVNPALARFRMQDLPSVWSTEYLNDGYTGLNVFDRTSGSDTYRGTEQNNSAYLLLSFTPANRFVEVYGGLRYEYNRQKIAAAIPPTSQYPINEPILVDNPIRSWLPSVSVSLRPSEKLVFRTSYGKTVNRTEFREVSPFNELDFVNNTILRGNPDLISASVDNYDLRLEFYPNAENGDVISAGVFYKEIENPIERINNSLRNVSAFPTISYANASSATLRGLELELRKSLSFIPGGLFRNLSVAANASFIRSRATFDYRPGEFMITERPLQGQAPYLINAGLYYDNPGWGSKLGLIYNTAGENIYAAGMGYRYSAFIDGPIMRGSLIELPRHLLDVSYTQYLGRGVQMRLTVQNLLNESVIVAEDYNFSNKYEKLYETPVDMGDNRMDCGDNISSKFNPGRYFSLILSYSF